MILRTLISFDFEIRPHPDDRFIYVLSQMINYFQFKIDFSIFLSQTPLKISFKIETQKEHLFVFENNRGKGSLDYSALSPSALINLLIYLKKNIGSATSNGIKTMILARTTPIMPPVSFTNTQASGISTAAASVIKTI